MRGQSGFSVVELLVVGAILGILALIAIPQYSSYRERAYNSAALADLKHVAAAQESFFAEHAAYKPIENCSGIAPGTRCALEGLPGIDKLSKGVSIEVSTSKTGFIAKASHSKGSKVCTWDTAKGGLIGCS